MTRLPRRLLAVLSRLGVDAGDIVGCAGVALVVWSVGRLAGHFWGGAVQRPTSALLLGCILLTVYVARELRLAKKGGP